MNRKGKRTGKENAGSTDNGTYRPRVTGGRRQQEQQNTKQKNRHDNDQT